VIRRVVLSFPRDQVELYGPAIEHLEACSGWTRGRIVVELEVPDDVPDWRRGRAFPDLARVFREASKYPVDGLPFVETTREVAAELRAMLLDAAYVRPCAAPAAAP
jgi:hypothetical protein